jgi:transcriptional regulator with XRE-family HTH domain
MDEGWEMAKRFAARVRQARLARGWDQTTLARQARVPPATISRLERGMHPGITLVSARKIAQALGLGLDYLADTFGGSEEAPAAVAMLAGETTTAAISL